MNTLLNYPGAKWGMAKEIVSLMPPHRSYLEPFFGSGAVLFNKPPSAIETVNDIDGDIVNFFSVLREQPEKLAAYIAMTPYSRDVYNDAHENRGSSDLERAWKFAIRCKMGHGFKTYSKTGFKKAQLSFPATHPSCTTGSLPDGAESPGNLTTRMQTRERK